MASVMVEGEFSQNMIISHWGWMALGQQYFSHGHSRGPHLWKYMLNTCI